MSELKAKVMIDNLTQNNLACEWGLAVHIEYNGKNILLDTGSSGKFADNAAPLGIDLKNVDFGVLSHAHYDHSDGLERFFGINPDAKFFIRDGVKENCYGSKFIFSKYIGIKKGTLEKYKDRIEFVSGDREICEGVYLIPHKTENLSLAGKKAGMFRKEAGKRVSDDFCHEQSLVIRTEQGLVIFSSCSHSGADNIIKEISDTFPNEKIYAMLGGFHLFNSKPQEIEALGDNIIKTGIEKICTGHCTGDKAYVILKNKLGDNITQLRSGFVFEV